MTHGQYEEHAIGRLCWKCHTPTCAGHLLQRRCPKCRKKWSYQVRQTEWELMKAFALDATAHRAAQVIGCSYPTAHKAFMACRRVLCDLTIAERVPLLVKLGLREHIARRSRSRSQPIEKAINHALFGIVEWNDSVRVITSGTSKEGLLMALMEKDLPGMVLFANRMTSIKDLRRYSGDTTRDSRAGRRPRAGRIEAFWRIVSERIRSHARGVGPAHLAFYSAEAEYRFNHSGDALVEVLYRALILPTLPCAMLENC